MPEKQKTSRTWKNPKTIIAALSLTGLLTLWNTFATVDRQRTGHTAMFGSKPTATPNTTPSRACLVPNPSKQLGIKCASVAHTRSS
jgi:hypothetical protein